MRLLLLFLSGLALFSCSQPKPVEVVEEEETTAIDLKGVGRLKLSEYGFFSSPMKDLRPAGNVLPYAINSQLFSDYAFKKRFISLPEGQKMKFVATDIFHFPEGTTLIKNFYYPADFSKPEENIRIIETRLLINENGTWKALTYIWNQEQTDADLEIAGRTTDVSWKAVNGEVMNIRYSVPNVNQCKNCHSRSDRMEPIGPSARQLNREEEGVNQLSHWAGDGRLEALPELKTVARLVSYDDLNESLDGRARAWLEINCAHCHREDGPAKTSGLYLLSSESVPMKIGIGKAPVAAGKGSGGLLYDIVPGKPEQSILIFRIESTDPGIMMPELGRTITHKEGVQLIQDWIVKMEPSR